MTNSVMLVPLCAVLATAGCRYDDSSNNDDPAGAAGSPGYTAGGNSGSDAKNPQNYAGANGNGETRTAAGPSRGSAIALTPDDDVVVSVNRDSGSVTVMPLTFSEAEAPKLGEATELSTGAGSEPWQVAAAPDGDTAYVVLRKDQKLVRIDNLTGDAKLGPSVPVGSEPTGIALTPNGTKAYVTNMVDGTVSVIDTASMKQTSIIDLNAALVATGLLGELEARPALAHPRSIAITNDGDDDDSDETAYVTEFYAQRKYPEAPDGSNADTAQVGIVYRVELASGSAKAIELAPLADIGFKDQNGNVAGCYPNQLQSVTLAGDFAYVTSICASPRGPIGPLVTKQQCTSAAECKGLVEPACVVPAASINDNPPASVCVDLASTKTTTAPVVSVVDTKTGKEVPNVAASLNERFLKLVYEKRKTPDDASRRFPLVPSDLAFVPGTWIAYVAANGADAVFRLVYNNDNTIAEAGSKDTAFINLNPKDIVPASAGGVGPIGLQVTNLEHGGKRFAVVANDISRNVSVLDFNTQAVAGGLKTPSVQASSTLPAVGSDEDKRLRGKKFFNTGLARWSLKGQGWGACQSCHLDGYSDNVTFSFARGPRQSTSLEGSFSSKDPNNQRIFNWTALFDEVDDFELNTRGVSGGVGATVQDAGLATANRIDIAALGHAGLSGSAADAADPANPLGLAKPSVLNDWAEITDYIRTIRSPRAATTQAMDDIAKGKELFIGANCQGCHGDEKWTVSTLFYDPAVATNNALKTTSWADLVLQSGFPTSLLPAANKADQVMRFAGAQVAEFDQIVCALRNVGTFGVAENAVAENGLFPELRANGQPAQGNEVHGTGYNPPSLLGMNLGAPYLHNGGARTLEALFAEDPKFAAHYRALSPNFLREKGEERADKVDKLVSYLLYIDEDAEIVKAPALGATGGDFCRFP